MSMKIRRLFKLTVIFLLLFSLFFLFAVGGSKDLIASLAILPGVVDSPDRGPLVELVKAIDDEYTEGTIKIEIYPFPRSIDNVITGKADFHMPDIKNPLIPESKLPFRYATEKTGSVMFVIYSHKDNIITKKTIDNALARGGDFPYKIEVGRGLEANFSFAMLPSQGIDQSLQKLERKRIDAVIWPQEEADIGLKTLKIKTINRALWGSFDDVIVISKGPEGDRINKILSDALKKLKKSGRLEKIYLKVHRPYDNWQPSKMNW